MDPSGMSPNGASNRHRYAGWVPTITGQLSFSLVGAARNTVSANGICADKNGLFRPRRHMVLSHTRRTKDLPWPFWLVGSARAEYILIGASHPSSRPVVGVGQDVVEHPDDIGMLTGRILVVPHHEGKAAKRVRTCLTNVRRVIAAAADASPRDTDTELDALGARITKMLRDGGAVTLGADFELYRTGEFRIVLDDDDSLNVVGEPGAADRFYDLLAKQMYYFAKDMAHRHYHHPDADDNLLPLTVVGSADDEDWRRDTLWALTRSVLEMRRRKSLAGVKHALGLLAYAEAFQAVLGQVKRLPTGGFRRISSGPVYDFQHTRQSLEATIEERSFRISTNAELVGLGVATMLGAVALWIAAVQITSVVCNGAANCQQPQVPNWIRGALRLSIEHPERPFGVLVTLGGLYVEFTRRSLLQIGPLGTYAVFFAEWAAALGADVSRALRRKRPVAGDSLGNAFGVVVTAVVLFVIVYSAGWAFRLWPNPLTAFRALFRG